MTSFASTCTLRPATTLDQPIVDSWASDKETTYFSPLGLLNGLNDPTTFNFMVEIEGMPVGVATLVVEKDTASTYLYICDEHKNKGLGSRVFLLLPSLQSTLPREVRYLLAEIDCNHEQAYRIIEKAGWERRPELDDAVHTRFRSFRHTLTALSA